MVKHFLLCILFCNIVLFYFILFYFILFYFIYYGFNHIIVYNNRKSKNDNIYSSPVRYSIMSICWYYKVPEQTLFVMTSSDFLSSCCDIYLIVIDLTNVFLSKVLLNYWSFSVCTVRSPV